MEAATVVQVQWKVVQFHIRLHHYELKLNGAVIGISLQPQQRQRRVSTSQGLPGRARNRA